MNNRTAERCGIHRSRVAVIHPSPFAVKSMHMHYMKTKSPCGSDIAITQSLPQMGRGYCVRNRNSSSPQSGEVFLQTKQ